jgi:ADP-ribosylglycohydrolase
VIPPEGILARQLADAIDDKSRQGLDVADLRAELGRASSVDDLVSLAEQLAQRAAATTVDEPHELSAIHASMDPARPTGPVGKIDWRTAFERAETSFLGAVVGCMLGKPLEADLTLGQIRAAATAVGEWPIRDYVSEALLQHLPDRHPSWTTTVRGRLDRSAPDDDIGYRIIGMLALERHGLAFRTTDILQLWLENIPAEWTWGPERTVLTRAALWRTIDPTSTALETWSTIASPGDERCGALIRVDPYGLAAAGRPALAADLAWRDAVLTHRGTGLYAAMYVAALLALAFVARDRLDAFERALQFVPQRSRFRREMADALDIVASAGDWADGHARVAERFASFGECAILQELGFLANSVRFADDIGHGVSLQVMQGLDTDSFGATAGGILGVLMGRDALDRRWLVPLQNRIEVALATFHEHRLEAVAERMGRLTLLAQFNQTATGGPEDG